MPRMSGDEAPVPASAVDPVEPDAEPLMSEAERLDALAAYEDGYVTVPLALLKTADRNPRRGAVADVVESLREFGQHRPVVVQRRSGQVIVGNHLYRAAETLGWADIDAFIVDDDDDKALRRLIADNAVGDKAGWDDAELAELLKETGAVPGMDERAVARLLATLEDEQLDMSEPTFPIVARPNEEYDYVMVVALNATDAAYLNTKFELRTEDSYKDSKKPVLGRSHVLSVKRLRELLGE